MTSIGMKAQLCKDCCMYNYFTKFGKPDTLFCVCGMDLDMTSLMKKEQAMLKFHNKYLPKKLLEVRTVSYTEKYERAFENVQKAEHYEEIDAIGEYDEKGRYKPETCGPESQGYGRRPEGYPKAGCYW